MKSFNLSRWALDHKSFVVYLMLVVAIAGLLQYGKLGREEDPPFTIKTMVVKTLWPGATTLETVQQITDRDREEARGAAQSRLPEELLQARRVGRVRHAQGRDAGLAEYPTSGIRHARRSATSSTRYRKEFRARSSTTSSAIPIR